MIMTVGRRRRSGPGDNKLLGKCRIDIGEPNYIGLSYVRKSRSGR